MDRDSIERIRTATFSVARRGYDKREVDRFLERVAEWLESGGDDDSRRQLVRNELERIGEETGKILVDAHDVGEGVRQRAEAEAAQILDEARVEADEAREAGDRYASGQRAEADAYSERTHIEADEYANETRGEADAYAAKTRNDANADAATTREDADEYAAATRQQADEESERVINEAEASARRMNQDVTTRREEIETVISDLEERRRTVIEDMQRLSTELTGTASQHEPRGHPQQGELEPEEIDEPEPAASRSGE